MKTNTGFYISKIKQLNTRLLNKLIVKKNLSAFNAEQGRILHVLWKCDNISTRELSKKTGLAMSSLTTMLERMVESGLIERYICKDDRRKIMVKLTDYAKILKKDYDEISDEIVEIIFDGINENEQIQLEKTLEKILENMENAEEKMKK